MVTVPLGAGAYKRLASGAPEVRLENRFFEKSPTNLREHFTLLARQGTSELVVLPSNNPGALSPLRGVFSKAGLFNTALFGVSGTNLYRYDADATLTPITGVVAEPGSPVYAWQKGIGYEVIFISDGLLLQYYTGPTTSTGVLTQSSPATSSDVIQIGSEYYSWNASVDTGSPDGTAGAPWLANPGADPMTALATMINWTGTPGVDFSTALAGPSTVVTAAADPAGLPPAFVTISSIATDGSGDAVATVVTSGADVSFGAATLAGGGLSALQGIPVPDGQSVTSIASVSGYTLLAIGNSQKFYWINPGELTIDPLNFAEKESNPDNIVDMLTVGDQVLIMGNGSTENWYATGDLAAPFAPIEGRVYARGVVAGTAAVVQDEVLLVGNDGVVYEIGSGVTRVSDHGIEERIRRQLRREQGLAP